MNKKGYTIAELIFALMLLTAFLLLNITMYTNSLKNVKEAERLSKAINLAVAKTETLQNTDYDEVITHEEQPYENYKVIVDVVEDLDPERLIDIDGVEDPYVVFKDITVTVRYAVGGKWSQIELKSLKVNNELIDAIYGEITI